MVDFIVWKDLYLCGVEEIDTQHKHLFSALNDLIQSIEENKKTVTEEVLKGLTVYLRVHFETEQNYLRVHPGFEFHIQEHNRFLIELEKIARSKNRNASYEVFLFLSNWIVTHLVELDLLYFEYIEKNTMEFVHN